IFNRFWRHVRQNRAFSQSVATENASPFRSPPGNPEGFQGIGPSHQKGYFFDGLKRNTRWVFRFFVGTDDQETPVGLTDQRLYCGVSTPAALLSDLFLSCRAEACLRRAFFLSDQAC
ncbi:MAG: hypothetical protein IJD86_13050, partial [Clostridia bacterium]|nr:hypothetical protein [Clostridia bacterium]